MSTKKIAIKPTDYVKYKLAWIGGKNSLPGLPMKDITLERATKEHTLEEILSTGLWELVELPKEPTVVKPTVEKPE